MTLEEFVYMQNLKNNLLSLGIFEDNQYLDFYCNLINDNRNKQKEKFKTQKHHIIPKIYFSINNIPIDNSKNNLVNLLYKDHILAHYYLIKMCKPHTSLFYKCVNAFIQMSKFNKFNYESFDITQLDNYQEYYEYWKCSRSKARLGTQLSNETKQKLSNSWDYEKHMTPTTKERISKSKKGKHVSEETKIKISKSLTGKSKSTKNRIIINNGKYIKYINTKDLDYYIDLGWKKGRIKGRLHSEATRAKISKSNKGKHSTLTMLGKKHSEATKKKMSDKKKGKPNNGYILVELAKQRKGKPVADEIKSKISKSMKGHKVSDETRRKMSESRLNYFKKLQEKNNDSSRYV